MPDVHDAAKRRSVPVVVVGGGPVGLACAVALGRRGWRVIVLGAGPAPRDGRTVAVMRGSLDWLRAVGVDLEARGDVARLRRLRIVDDTGSLFRLPPVTFDAAELGLDAFGVNIEAASLVDFVRMTAAATPGVTLDARRVRGFNGAGAAASLALEDGSTLEAALVVATDGRASPTRAAAGIAARRREWRQTALTAILCHEHPHGDVSTEFHTRAGPCTLVPLPGLRSSLVWMMRDADATRRAALPDGAFAREIERATHYVLGRLAVAGPRGRAPLATVVAERLTGPRLMLAGEAAHAFPPIGAQGLNLGLRDAACVESLLGDEAACGERLWSEAGSRAILSAYEAERRGDVDRRTAAVDALNGSLLSGTGATDLARGAGLLALAASGPLRRLVMREGLAPRPRGTVSAAPSR